MAGKILIVGAGPRGREHATAARAAGWTVSGIVDPIPSARRDAELLGPVYPSLPAALEAVEADVALVATPATVRTAVLRELLARPGWRAIAVEKPLALSWAEGCALVEACEAAGVPLVVCHQLRCAPEFVRLRDAIRSGELGAIQHVHAECYGTVFDQGSHLVDLVGWLVGEPVRWVLGQACDEPFALSAAAGRAIGNPSAGHPGPRQSAMSIGLGEQVVATLLCGPLISLHEPALGPWLQKRVSVVGSAGAGHAQVALGGWTASRRGAYRAQGSDVGSYGEHTRRFHEALAAALDAGGAWPCLATEALEGLAVIEAAGRARLTTFPLSPGGTEAGTSAPAVAAAGAAGVPRLSVLAPLRDHRGLWDTFLAGWTEGQRGDPAAFELIVIVDATTADIAEQVAARLRPWDQLLRDDGTAEVAQYHLGAEAARGGWLLFTEPHCIPESTCAQATLARLETSDGFCLRSSMIPSNRLGRAERALFEEGFVEWSRPDHWGKVLLRGVVVRRSAYFDVGGFDLRYGRFAEWLLAAQLHRKGYRLSYEPGPGVAHLDSQDFPRLLEAIDDFTSGECRFRLEHSEREWGEYFTPPPEWQRGMRRNPELLREVQGLLGRQVLGMSGRCRSLLGLAGGVHRLIEIAIERRFGLRLLAWWTWLAYAAGRLRFALELGSDARARRVLGRLYQRYTEWIRLRELLRRGPLDPAPPPSAVLDVYRPAELPNSELYGFQGPERRGDRVACWSEGVAALRVRAAPGRYRVVLELRPGRVVSAGELGVTLDGELLTLLEVDPSGERLTGIGRMVNEVAWLVLIVPTWPRLNPHDRRELGICVEALRLEPLATPGGGDAATGLYEASKSSD